MRRKRNIKRSIAIRIRRVYANFPVLWRKRTDFSDEHLGIREKFLFRMAAHWVLKNEKTENYASIVRKLETNLQNRYSAEEKRVLFVVEHVSPRLSKMVKALHDTGYHVTLLHSLVATDDHKDLEDAKKCCECYFDYEGIAQLSYLIIDSRIPIIHYFVSWGDMSTAILLFQAKGILPKIIVERYDILNGMYIQKQILFKQEQYLMECADGVCCREYAGEYCKEELGFHMRRDPLLFWDYADQALTFDKKEDELSICYAGGITTEEEGPECPHACFLELAAICEENKCHLHVYPSVWREKEFAIYVQYEKQHKYFHIHKPVEFSKLYKELGQYDYGIHPMKKTYQDKAYNQQNYTTDKFIYAATNKYFDYISTGLPMIGAVPVKQTQDLEKTGIILRWTIEELDFDELRRRRKELRDNLLENRAYWMIQNHISDLTDYYKTVLE